jgi:Ni/Co efflux regulator RcnB
MIRRIVAATLATALLAAALAPLARAEDTPVKPVTPQQQKMKDCAAKWKDEKAKTDAKGREAYSKFMSGCLKG